MPLSITKSIKSEIKQIESLTKRLEARYRKDFIEYVNSLKSEASLKEIRSLLERGDIQGVYDLIESKSNGFKSTVFWSVLTGGLVASSILGPKALKASGMNVNVTFDPTTPEATEIIRERSTNLIKELNDSQRRVIDQIFSEAQGLSTKDIAQKIKQSLGLTLKQKQAVDNYERLLRKGSAQALDRNLRDRRFDRSVEGAKTKPLTEEQIQRMVKRYRDKTLAFRAMTISRTESNYINNRAYYEALRQTIQTIGIDPSTVKRTWRATRDKRTRGLGHDHHSLNGQVVGLNEPFVDHFGNRLIHPLDGSLNANPSTIINCRCTTTVSFS